MKKLWRWHFSEQWYLPTFTGCGSTTKTASNDGGGKGDTTVTFIPKVTGNAFLNQRIKAHKNMRKNGALKVKYEGDASGFGFI